MLQQNIWYYCENILSFWLCPLFLQSITFCCKAVADYLNLFELKICYILVLICDTIHAS